MNELNIALDAAREFLIEVGRFLPRLLVALLILIAGWLLAKLARTLIVRGLKAARFQALTDKLGIDAFLKQGGMKRNAGELVGALAYWVVMLLALLTTFNVLGLGIVTELLKRILLYLPNVVVAVIVLALGLYFARFMAEVVAGYGRNVGLTDADLFGRLTRYGILAFTVVIALDQLQIGQAILVPAFLILFGGLCLALAIMFGLGGQRWASEVLERFFERNRKK
jgi:hypothetical protein